MGTSTPSSHTVSDVHPDDLYKENSTYLHICSSKSFHFYHTCTHTQTYPCNIENLRKAFIGTWSSHHEYEIRALFEIYSSSLVLPMPSAAPFFVLLCEAKLCLVTVYLALVIKLEVKMPICSTKVPGKTRRRWPVNFLISIPASETGWQKVTVQ